MAPIVASVEISRSPEDVFAYITDPSHLPEWQESVVRVKTDDSPPTGGGSRSGESWSGRIVRSAVAALLS